MSFLFRKSLSKDEEQPIDVDDSNNQKSINEKSEAHLDDNPELSEKAIEDIDSKEDLTDDKNLESQKKVLKTRTSFLKNLVGSSSRNTSSSSLVSSSSSTSSSGGLPPLPPIILNGYKPNSKHRLIDQELANNIRNLLPARLQLFDSWDLVYSLNQHGISLNTLYRNSRPEHQLAEYHKRKKFEKGYGESIVNKMMVTNNTSKYTSIQPKRPQGYVLIIKDENNSKFGAFLNENLKPMDHKRYYGNGECFLWKCERYDPSKLNHNKVETSKNTSKHSKHETRFKAFMYTGINDNIIYSNHDFIAIGSSQGQNGLFIDKSLCKGVSYACETFGNEALNSIEGQDTKFGSFKILNLEVWRIGSLE
ncbi:OXR1 [Candida pseudojiufengensis]|uniref:OXR1 n=1 Tax=Candida pseudojiufengensis TaxID=497109 RepID=UPI0022243688|nr:OXR1 [Candida pseudojiufengensis]KAI5960441.1 OXR1 [Candida pseudojiufengensis]